MSTVHPDYTPVSVWRTFTFFILIRAVELGFKNLGLLGVKNLKISKSLNPRF